MITKSTYSEQSHRADTLATSSGGSDASSNADVIKRYHIATKSPTSLGGVAASFVTADLSHPLLQLIVAPICRVA